MSQTEKIYLTYKTRMVSEARLRRTSFITNVFIAWYSFSLIALSLIDISNQFEVLNFSMLSAVVAIALFAASLFVYGERYNERAAQFRECYLKLQSLYESSLTESLKMKRYAEILSHYENQSDRDFDEMVFDAWMRGQALRNASADISPNWPTLASVAFRRLLKLGMLGALFTIPIVFGALWIKAIP